MQFMCAYCGNTDEESATPPAHIFPDAIGGVLSPKTTVCRRCNTRVNRSVEQRAVRSLAFFRSLWGIEDRRGKIPRVPTTLTAGGISATSTLNAEGRPDHVAFSDVDGSGLVLTSTSLDALEAKVRELNAKTPDQKWDEPERVKILAEIELLQPSDQALRRLAAKVGFEFFALLRGGHVLQTSDFDDVRAFILEGREDRPRCAVVSNERWLSRQLQYPLPSHAAHIVAHDLDRTVGCLVTLFGLYSYAVVLSDAYPTLAPIDELLLEYPTLGETTRPALRWDTVPSRLAWAALLNGYRRAPDAADAIAIRRAQSKITTAPTSS